MSSIQLVITTSRLMLRPFEPTDAADICRLGGESTKAAFLPDWVHTEQEAEGLIRHFRRCMEEPDPRRGPVAWAVVLRETGELIGHAGMGPKHELGGEVEIGYAVSERYAGRGLATEAAKAAIWWAFECYGLDYLVAIVLPQNAASRRVLDKLGFVPAGSRVIADCGPARYFDYLRLYRLDGYSDPEWTSEHQGEPMEAFFDKRADGYEAHILHRYGAEHYVESVGPVDVTEDAVEILDLGCGTGLELKWLFQRAPNARVTCLDLSLNMLELLKSSYADRLGQITIVQASYIDWQYPEGAYDYVLSVTTMHHFSEPMKVGIYRNIKKALKPGGKYIESDFMVDDIMMEQFRRRYRRIMGAAGLCKAAPGSLHVDIPLTPMLQKELLHNAGFPEVVSYRESIQARGRSKAVLVASLLPPLPGGGGTH